MDKFNKWSDRVIKKLKLTLSGKEIKPFVVKNIHESSIITKPVSVKASKNETKTVKIAKTEILPEKKTEHFDKIIQKTNNEEISNEKITESKTETKNELNTVAEPEIIFNNKPKKFVKKVGAGKITKANAFQIQQKLVKNEAKNVVSTVTAVSDVRAPVTSGTKETKEGKNGGGCCGSTESKGEKEVESSVGCCQSNKTEVSSLLIVSVLLLFVTVLLLFVTMLLFDFYILK